MVLWCKLCGAFMGLREPLSDWSTDREAICAFCAEKQLASDKAALEQKIAAEKKGMPEN